MCYHRKGPYGVVTVRFFFVPWIQQKPRAWRKVARLLAGGGGKREIGAQTKKWPHEAATVGSSVGGIRSSR